MGRRVVRWGAGWGGGLVVVRARERRVHGEGGQQVRQGGGWNAGRTLVNTGELGGAVLWLSAGPPKR